MSDEFTEARVFGNGAGANAGVRSCGARISSGPANGRCVRRFALFCCLATCAAVMLSARPSVASVLSKSSFAYRAITRLPPTDREERRGAVVVREISIPLSAGGARKALVVSPAGRGPHPGVLMVHWLGDAATSNRSEFLPDAIELAKHGVVSVLPDAMWSVPNWYERVRTYPTDYANSIDQVRDLRRAMDVLLLQPGVDPHRTAYVGHDFGGMYGAVFAGVDARARFYVIMCATAEFGDWYLYLKPPPNKAAYIAKMSLLDPIRYLPKAGIVSILFQYARGDFYVPAAKMNELYLAAPGPKLLLTYRAKHDLRLAVATHDRRTWLLEHLQATSALH